MFIIRMDERYSEGFARRKTKENFLIYKNSNNTELAWLSYDWSKDGQNKRERLPWIIC